MYDLIIIGGGAASQAAAMYAIGKRINFLMVYKDLGGRVGKRVLMRTEEDVPVGHILVHMESVDDFEKEDHLIGSEAVHLFETHIMQQTGHVLKDEVVSVAKVDDVFHVTTGQHGVQQGRTVIVATGDRQRPLDVPGKSLLIRGLGYISATRADKFQGKTAAVFGATERAFHGVAELAQTAQKVYLVSPEAIKPTVPIVKVLQQRSNVEIVENYELVEAIGTTEITQVVIRSATQTQRLDVDVAFMARGLIPNSDVVREFVETDADGFIKVNERNATNVPGLFAAGEVTTIFGREVLIAIGEGARAALSAHDYLLAYVLQHEVGK